MNYGQLRTFPSPSEVQDEIALVRSAPLVVDVVQVGSSLIPGVIPSDIDLSVAVSRSIFLGRCPDSMRDAVIADLVALGYVPAKPYPGDDWQAMRKGDFNLLVQFSPMRHALTVQASSTAVLLGLTRKADRVALHRHVVDGDDIATARAAGRQFAP